MDAAALGFAVSVRPDRRRAGVRLSQRDERCGQLDRHHRLDPRAAPAICGGLGSIFQFRRLSVFRPARRRNRRPWHCRGRCCQLARDLRCTGGRDRLADRHAAARDSLFEFARTDRRACRRRDRKSGRGRRGLVRRDQDSGRDFPVAWVGLRARFVADAARVVGLHSAHSVWRRSYFPPRTIRVGVLLCARPWRQRCAKDDGNHCGAAVFARQSRNAILRAVLGGDRLPGRDGGRHAGRRLAHCAHHGLARSRG